MTTDKKVYEIQGDLTRLCEPTFVTGEQWFYDVLIASKGMEYSPPDTPLRFSLQIAKFSPDGPPDVIGDGDALFCSQAFKDIAEALEPEVHDFVPATVYYSKKDYPYYVLRPQIHEAIDVEASTQVDAIEWVDNGRERFWMERPNVPLVLDAEQVTGKHLWQQRVQFGLFAINFISGELRAEIERHELIHCWELQEQIVGAPATV